MKHGGEIMEQLILFESGEMRRLPRYGDDRLGRVSGGFQLQYEHLNGQLSKETQSIGLRLWMMLLLISYLQTLHTI